MQISTPLSGELGQYLDLSSALLKVTAENMANVDTPGYRTLGFDFAGEMERQVTEEGWHRRGQTDATTKLGAAPRLSKVDGLLERPDGNNVSMDREGLEMPHDSLFTDQQREAKASVVLKLKHRSLNEEEADSVRNLVASAVDELRPDNVILAEADGHAVLGRKSASAEAEAHEQLLAEKLIETLEPVAGAGNVRVSVNVDYDTLATDETDETYDPASVVTLSMQKSQQTSSPQPAASGVPGTASNAPNVQPPLFPSQTASVQSATQEAGTYGASTRTRHLQQGPGKVRRVTAAVLVNDRMQAGGKQSSWRPRDPEEMKRLTMLAEAAIGYDQARGDPDASPET